MTIKRVTVFGGSAPKPGGTAYCEAQRMGKLLGSAGYTVLTGGYIGAMEAVSRGAAEAGAKVIGVTCDEIEAWRPVRANQWVMEEMRFPTLRERLFALIDTCDAAIALPGGPGTLAEVSLMWNQMIIRSIPARPLILVGAGWTKSFESFFHLLGEYIPEAQREMLKFSPSIENAISYLHTYK
jgi:uncharacterized protein (TIGR00730 family)